MWKKIPRELQVGFVAVVAIALAIIGVSYLQGRSALERSMMVVVSYENIDGLMSGNRVLYNGMQVGQVRDIRLNTASGRVDVTFDVSRAVGLTTDSKAMLVSLDIFNVKGIKLLRGRSKELMENGDTIRDTVETGLVASLQGELMPVKDNINVLVSRLNRTIALLNGTLGDSLLYYQATSMGRIVTNIEVVTAQLAAASKDIKSTVVSVRTTSDDLQKTLAILKQNESNINQILTNVNHFTDTLKQSLGPIRDNLNGTMTGIRDVLDRANRGEGNLGLLLKDDKLYRNLERTSEDLDRLLIDIRQHPSRYVHISLFGKKEKKDMP